MKALKIIVLIFILAISSLFSTTSTTAQDAHMAPIAAVFILDEAKIQDSNQAYGRSFSREATQYKNKKEARKAKRKIKRMLKNKKHYFTGFNLSGVGTFFMWFGISLLILIGIGLIVMLIIIFGVLLPYKRRKKKAWKDKKGMNPSEYAKVISNDIDARYPKFSEEERSHIKAYHRSIANLEISSIARKSKSKKIGYQRKIEKLQAKLKGIDNTYQDRFVK